jgi:hypothetical protein
MEAFNVGFQLFHRGSAQQGNSMQINRDEVSQIIER